VVGALIQEQARSLKTAMMWTIRNTHLLEMFGWNEALPSYVVAAPRLFGGSGLTRIHRKRIQR
jgi:hypothetical protein